MKLMPGQIDGRMDEWIHRISVLLYKRVTLIRKIILNKDFIQLESPSICVSWCVGLL
jgi:hypothetical protein